MLADITGDVDVLDAFLEEQNYRIAYWRSAGRDLGYRRFFDIDTLVGLRVEDPDVFADAHDLILRWVRDGVVDGLRVDHPDGLRDPEQYLDRLARASGGVWTVVEKILVPGEELPSGWPVAGTTGYDRRALIDGLFLDPAGEGPLTEGYAALTGAPTDAGAVVAEAREFAVRNLLAADVARLTALLVEVCEGRRHQRDRSRHELHEAVMALVAAFPVYRTYVRAEAGLVRREDEERVTAALAAVGDAVDPDLAAFLADLLLLRLPDRRPLEDEWVMQFQQLTGPAMAKGVEDTAFYRYNRLLALNEVGGDLRRFGVAPDEFHRANLRIQRPLAGHDDDAVDPRHQAVGRRAGPAGAAVGAAGRVGERLRAVDGGDGRAVAGRRARSPRPAPAVPDPGRGLAAAGRPGAGVPGQGDARGQARHVVDRARRGLRGGPGRVRRGGARRRRGGRRRRRLRRRAGGAGPDDRAGPDARGADGPGRAGHLPGRRAVGPQPGRPRQPPAGRLRRAGASCSPSWPRGRRRRRSSTGTTRACPSWRSSGPPWRCGAAGRRRSARARPAPTPPWRSPARPRRMRWPSPGAPRRRSWCRGWSSAWRTGRAAGRGRRPALPAGRWRDVITGEPAEGGPVAVADLLRRFPVALLERAG